MYNPWGLEAKPSLFFSRKHVIQTSRLAICCNPQSENDRISMHFFSYPESRHAILLQLGRNETRKKLPTRCGICEYTFTCVFIYMYLAYIYNIYIYILPWKSTTIKKKNGRPHGAAFCQKTGGKPFWMVRNAYYQKMLKLVNQSQKTWWPRTSREHVVFFLKTREALTISWFCVALVFGNRI